MTDELSPAQALALWGLLARQGRAGEKDVKAADRAALVAAGLAEADKPSKTVSLTDRGWNWASERLDAPGLDKQPVLALFLARLGAHIRASGGTLAAFIGEAPPLPAPAAKAKAPAKKAPAKPRAALKEKATSKPKGPKILSAPAVRKRIEEAYLRITGGVRSEFVRLSKIRTELGDLNRETVDAALEKIVTGKREKARLTQIDDNKEIDAAERGAAFSPSGEPYHLLWIP